MNKYNLKYPSIDTLIISGGGTRGVYFLGALSYYDEKKLLDNINTFIGTSIGSMICLLLVIGYKIKEIVDFFDPFNFSKLLIQADIDKLLSNYGFDDCDRVMFVTKMLLQQKNIDENITFLELKNLTSKTLILTATCLTYDCVKYFDWKTEPSMSVLLAFKMSICVPIVYQPIIYNDAMYVDGGLLDNYPIQLAKNNLDHTLGLVIIDRDLDSKIEITDFLSYLYNTINCAVFSKMNSRIKKYEKYTIVINTHAGTSINVINFDISIEEKQKMKQLGIEAASKYYANRINELTNDFENIISIYDNLLIS